MRKCKRTKHVTRGTREGKVNIESIMFIIQTWKGVLKRRLKNMKERLGLRNIIKYVESMGKCVGDMLIRSILELEAVIGAHALSEPQGKCMNEGLVYVIECKVYKGKKAVYFGDSSCSAYDRGLE